MPSLLIDLTGKRFGRWTVIARAESDRHKNTKWLCRCDCGAIKAVSGGSLRRGHTKSCGCLAGELTSQRCRMPPGRAAFNNLFRRYKKYGAEGRGLVWGLTREDFSFLTKMNCHYCGGPPARTTGQFATPYFYTGIDRMDNTRGYTLDNVVPCCETCNRAKGSVDYNEFTAWLDRICRYRQ